MSLAYEMQTVIEAYLEHRLTLGDLHGWLAEHVQAIADEASPEATRMSGRMWSLLGEYQADDINEAELRQELDVLIRPSSTTWVRIPEDTDPTTAGETVFARPTCSDDVLIVPA